MSDNDLAFRRLRAAGLLQDDPDLVALFPGDPAAPNYADKARASRPHFFARDARQLSPQAYAAAERELLAGARRKHWQNHHARRLEMMGLKS